VVNKYAPQNWFPYLIATWGGWLLLCEEL
jgi:hypothetical protein